MADMDKPELHRPGETQRPAMDSAWRPARLAVCLAGGPRIIRSGIRLMLESRNIAIHAVCSQLSELAEAIQNPASSGCQAIVLILIDAGAFQTFTSIRDALKNSGNRLPLVVLTGSISRAQVYTALRQGVRGYVSMDADPQELVKAIEMAVADKVHLSTDAAELVVSDISSSAQGIRSHAPKVALSRREVQIVQLLCDGMSSREVGEKLHISSKTVENHRYNIYRKCDVDSIAGLIRHAIRQGIISV